MESIIIKNEIIVMSALKKGLKVEGRIWLEENEKGECVICFACYNRKPQTIQHNKLIRRLEHGWVKESVERIKVYESIPKNLGTARVIGVLERESKEVKSALMDRELIEFM